MPAADTSSHWQLYGGETTVESRGDELVLSGSGFGSMKVGGRLGRAARLVERLTYWPVTARLRCHPLVWRTAKQVAHDLSADLTYDVWRQSVALATLADHWAAYGLSPRTFAIIGDGHGFLGALIRRYVPQSRVYCIDLPKMLVFQARTHELADSGGSISIISSNSTSHHDVTLVLPKDVAVISEPIDCAINIASMQEMTQRSITGYFDFLRERSTPTSRFYCVNRLRKELPEGEVASFEDYPWQKNDDVFIDGPCPYYTHVVGRTGVKGPEVLGVRVPFINHFDGTILHRLVHLAAV